MKLYWKSMDFLCINWKLYWIITVVLLYQIGFSTSLRKGRLMVPPTYSALSHDLHIQLQIEQYSLNESQNLNLKITRIDNYNEYNLKSKIIGYIEIFLDQNANVTQITIPCNYFIRGGLYWLEIVDKNSISNNNNNLSNYLVVQDERLRQQLDVRWPIPKLSVTPESIGTYPQESLTAILEFLENKCILPNFNNINANSLGAADATAVNFDLPEFWLELLYCGRDIYCNSDNITKTQILYKEQVRGFPKTRIIKLSCELFGLAGHYIFKLKPDATIPSSVSASAYIKADWSEQFVFNVHARNIFPCDHSGIGVLFEYPSCILDQADRIRLFAKQRADVASLAPPTSLHYITEQRVNRGQHSLYFNCDLFSEKYVEYCFVYVSQAITNAVADVRMDCVPTLEVRESDTGGWGAWSEWTPCSTTCAGGTRNRYRFCDSPPPRYGAKFCEGSAVETERCGGPVSGTWECLYGAGSGNIPADRPEVIAEVGPGCRCGCIVHLGVAKPRRLIAASSKSCPGRTFWLIQADDDNRVRLKFDFFHLPCTTQWLKIKDGDSLTSELIGYFIGGNLETDTKYESIVSTGSQLLVEFFSDELQMTGQSCGGGFLAHAQQLQGYHNLTMLHPNTKAVIQAGVQIAPVNVKLTMAHLFVILFISIMIVISLLLGAQYIFRYRKYQLAESMGEPDSPAHTPRTSLTSFNLKSSSTNRRHGDGGENLTNHGLDNQPPSRAISTTTLISEVISLVKLRPNGRCVKHSRLRESIDIESMERGEGSHEDGGGDGEDGLTNQAKSQSDDDISICSTQTLTNENLNDLDNPTTTSTMKRKSKSTITNCRKIAPTTTKIKFVKKNTKFVSSINSNDGDCITDEEDIMDDGDKQSGYGDDNDDDVIDDDEDDDEDDDDDVDETGSVNSYNRSISLPPTPSETPIPLRKLNKKGKYSAGGSDTRSVNGKTVVSRRGDSMRDVSPVREEDICESNVDDLELRMMGDRRTKVLSVSNVTLTNVRGCYSPASSMISTATIRTTNPKECKEKQNREKLLAGPGSEFSLANPEDLELDYYDYNVINAGAAPGSYLGMDPAYLVWIPPIDDGNIINEIDNDDDRDLDDDDDDDIDDSLNEPHYEEILPRHNYIDPGSNTETPDDEIAPELPPPYKPIMDKNNKCLAETIFKEIEMSQHNSPIKLDDDVTNNKRNLRNLLVNNNYSNNSDRSTDEIIQLHDFAIKTSSNNMSLAASSSSLTATTPTPTSSFNNYKKNLNNRNSNLISATTSLLTHHKPTTLEKETSVVKSTPSQPAPPPPPPPNNEYYELDDIQFADDDEDNDDDDDDNDDDGDAYGGDKKLKSNTLINNSNSINTNKYKNNNKNLNLKT